MSTSTAPRHCPVCRGTGQKYPGMGLSMPASELPCETCWGLPSGPPELIAANRESILAARAAEEAEERARLSDPNYRAPLERIDPGRYE